jgi:hypothetical protein
MTDATAEAWIAAWDARAARDCLDPGRDYWERRWGVDRRREAAPGPATRRRPDGRDPTGRLLMRSIARRPLSAERAGALVGGREEDLDFLTEVPSAERQVADLRDNDGLPKRTRDFCHRARELCSAARVAGDHRRHEAAKENSREDKRSCDTNSHSSDLLSFPRA